MRAYGSLYLECLCSGFFIDEVIILLSPGTFEIILAIHRHKWFTKIRKTFASEKNRKITISGKTDSVSATYRSSPMQ